MDFDIDVIVALPEERVALGDADIATPTSHAVANHQAVEISRGIDPLDLVWLLLPGAITKLRLQFFVAIHALEGAV